ncbi:polysaccharide biosynthesis protein [Micromonospora sp. NPDC003197]
MTQGTERDTGAGSSRLGLAGAAVTGAAMLTNGLAFLVPMLGARRLSAGDLGALATVLALGGLAGVPGLGLQIAVAVRRARYGRIPTTRVTVATAAITGGALLAATPLLTSYLHLPVSVAVLLAPMAIPVVLAGRWLGELQGDQRFLRLAAGMGALAAGRYGGLIVGLATGAGLPRSLLVGVVTSYLALPILAWLAARDQRADAGLDPVAGLDSVLRGRSVLTAGGATLAMLAVSYADLLLARQLLPVAESGGYAVGSVLTKGALWAPQVVTVLALPRLARGDRRTRSVALVVTAVCGAVLVAASSVAGEFAIRLAGGSDYLWLADYAPLFAAVGALYALVFVLVNAQVAAGAPWPSGPLWVALGGLTVVAVLVAPRSLSGILGAALATAAVTALVLGWIVHRPRRSRPANSGREAAETN